jgi:hypothetical protein
MSAELEQQVSEGEVKTPVQGQGNIGRELQGWDHELELGNDLRTEQRLVWKEAIVIILVLAVAAVRIFLV